MGIRFNERKRVWEASYNKRHPITRQSVGLRRQAKSKAEALRIEKQLVLEVERKLQGAVVPTWDEAIVDCLRTMKASGITDRTIETYKLSLEAHTDEWKEKLVTEITTEQIRDLVNSKLSDKSESHKKNVLKFIRKVFANLVESGMLDRNPSPTMKFKVNDKLKLVLSEKQARCLLESARNLKSPWYSHWAFALHTGMRNGELYALRWEDVDLDAKLFRIRRSWNSTDGFKTTKSGDERIVEIAPSLLPIVKELKLKMSYSPFVLPRMSKWDKGEQSRELRRFLAGLNLPIIRFHDLRATWATMLLGKGVEPIKVMAMGGWKDIKTMMIYARKAGIDIRGSLSCLDFHDPTAKTGEVIEMKHKSGVLW